MAYQLTVLYHHPEDPEAFDAYYEQTHVPLALKLPGLKSYTTSKPGDGADSAPAEYLLAMLLFEDQPGFTQAISSDEGQAAVADVGNFATGGATMISGPVKDWA